MPGIQVSPAKLSPLISACSFQENVFRASTEAILTAYNKRIGGIEGRGIGFEESTDEKGRRRLKHSFLNFHGLHEIEGLENQILILLFMAWFIADQYTFRFKQIVSEKRYGFDNLHFTVVSDRLSGDDDFRRKNELNLRHLIDPDNEFAPLNLVRSKISDTFSGDLLADNLAGWLTAAMIDPSGSLAEHASKLVSTGVWEGWHHLQPSTSELLAHLAINRLLK